MTVYKHKSEDKVPAKVCDKESAAVVTDDDETSEDGDQMNSYLVKGNQHTMYLRRRTSILTWFIALLVLFVVLSIIGTITYYPKTSSKSAKPYIELVRMRYHYWKDNAAGVKRSFKVEGEFYQQVEIDINHEAYEKLNVPTIMDMQRAAILHDFDQKLTAIISLDRGHCFILPLNFTFVTPLREFNQLVRNIKAGYDSNDGEVTSVSYAVMPAKITDVSQFGQHIHLYCQHLDTYRLVRDEEPLELDKKSACRFRGERYCLGNAGTAYMGAVHISRCLQ